MNTQQIKLGLALADAGITVNVDTFDDRLILQKAVYLLQEAGIHLGYRYRWYLRGPYSPDLTGDAFLLARGGDEAADLSKWNLDEVSKKRISGVKMLFEGNREELPQKLELFASVLFLLKTRQANPDNALGISKILKANSKPFEPSDVEEALTTLRKHAYAL
jgi:uncharacterized protein YwgA